MPAILRDARRRRRLSSFEAAPEKLPLKQELFVELERHDAGPTRCSRRNTSVIPIGRIAERVCDARTASSARIGGTRLTSCRWSRWSRPNGRRRGSVEPHDRAAPLGRQDAGACEEGRRRASSATGCSMRSGARRWRSSQEGICDAETVDTVVKASFGRRLAVLGPLENADLVGTDLTLDIHENVLPHHRPDARAPALSRRRSSPRASSV